MSAARIDDRSLVIELKNEFARVRISKEETANGPRLMIVDAKNHKVGFLDPLELESLAWAKHSDLTALLDPARILPESPDGSDDEMGF